MLDLDGTLVDTAADIMCALNTVLQRHGRIAVTLDAVKAMVGDGMARLVEKGFAATGGLPADNALADAKIQMRRCYDARPAISSKLYPNVGETLLMLKADGCKLAVCTNKHEQAARRLLAELGIAPLLDDIVGGDTLAVRKPAPGHLLGTLDRLGRPSSTAVMVGDSQNDVAAARSAGIPMIFVSYGYNALPLETLAPDYVIGSFAQLPEILSNYRSGSCYLDTP